MSTNDVTREAEHRFAFDVMFHAEVRMAVDAVEADLVATTGNQLTSADRSLATLAACCALTIRDRSLLRRDKESSDDGR